MKFIICAKDWQDYKKSNLDYQDIKEYLAQFYKFQVNPKLRKYGYTINYRWYKFLGYLRAHRITTCRIVRIEYLVISKHFEIMYRKRHYGNIGVHYYQY